MKQAKRAVAGRVVPGLMALWLIFMAVFSWYQVKSTRERLLLETDQIMQVELNSLVDSYIEFYESDSQGMLFAVDGVDAIRARMTVNLNNLRNAGIEAVLYDENLDLLAEAEPSLLVGFEVTPKSENRRYGEFRYGLMRIDKVLSPEDAQRLKDYLSYANHLDPDPNALYDYGLAFGRVYTDGYQVIPLEFAVYEHRGHSPNGYKVPSFDENGVYENNSDCAIVWEYHADLAPDEMEGWHLLDEAHVYTATSFTNFTTDEQKAKVRDRELIRDVLFGGVEELEGELWQSATTFLSVDGFFETEFFGDWPAYVLGQTMVYGLAYCPRIYATGTVYPLREALPSIGVAALFSFVLVMVVGIILICQMGKVLDRERELEQRRRSLTNSIAHDLKTPMAAVLGYAENLMEQTNPEKQAHYLTALQSQTLRMNDILGKMLELSTTERGETSLTLSEFSLREAAVEAAGNVLLEEQPEIIGDGVLTADRGMILRVLENYLSNALRHRTAGTKLRIEIGEGRCCVYNQGKNIPEEALEKIWEPCYQAEPQRNSGCSGLGLTICREILTLHHFSYGVENREAGVAFWFRWEK